MHMFILDVYIYTYHTITLINNAITTVHYLKGTHLCNLFSIDWNWIANLI